MWLAVVSPGCISRTIAADFGISESCLTNWLKAADVEDGLKPGSTAAENAELRTLKQRNRLPSRRTRCCAMPRRICPRANLPGK